METLIILFLCMVCINCLQDLTLTENLLNILEKRMLLDYVMMKRSGMCSLDHGPYCPLFHTYSVEEYEEKLTDLANMTKNLYYNSEFDYKEMEFSFSFRTFNKITRQIHHYDLPHSFEYGFGLFTLWFYFEGIEVCFDADQDTEIEDRDPDDAFMESYAHGKTKDFKIRINMPGKLMQFSYRLQNDGVDQRKGKVILYIGDKYMTHIDIEANRTEDQKKYIASVNMKFDSIQFPFGFDIDNIFVYFSVKSMWRLLEEDYLDTLLGEMIKELGDSTDSDRIRDLATSFKKRFIKFSFVPFSIKKFLEKRLALHQGLISQIISEFLS